MTLDDDFKMPIKGMEPDKKKIEDSSDFEFKEQIKNPNAIGTNSLKGPLIVLFGPSEVGKTVTLLRLTKFIETHAKYNVKPVESFRGDSAYASTIAEFNRLKSKTELAPSATGEIDFLLLNAAQSGKHKFQILEAPGEHFFDKNKPNEPYYRYFEDILNSSHKKLFVFFFTLDMLDTNDQRRAYGDKISQLINARARSGRDRVIILCNKVDKNPERFKNGLPVIEEFKNEIYANEAYSNLTRTLKSARLKRIYFVPFSAGHFTTISDSEDDQVLAMSDQFYPRSLFRSIEKCLFPSWLDNLFS